MRDDEVPLTKAIIDLASEYGRYGYRPPAPQTIKTKPKLPAYVQPIPDQLQWHLQLNPN